jgi:cytochrome c peroxidase
MKSIVIFHDCGHYSYFPNKIINYIVGSILGIIVLTPFSWNYDHVNHHLTNGNFENNGIPLDSTLNDIGRQRITEKPEDYLKFKVPTLRNIQFTNPYMHDGRFNKLTEVIKHYNSIGNNKKVSKQLKISMNLSDNERVDLVAFLLTLTDNEFLFNKSYSYPR